MINHSSLLNRFDDFDLTRPSTAPSPSGTAQNRPNTGVLSSLRTGLEPQIFSPTKTTTESSKSHDWLGLKDESSDEDEPVITTLVKKTPIAPIQGAIPTVSESPKKSLLDDL